MSKESTRVLAIVGGFIVFALLTTVFLGKKDELASNHYRLQALNKCEEMIVKEPCIERVERDHKNCFRAFIEQRDGDVDGYARCIGMRDEKFGR